MSPVALSDVDPFDDAFLGNPYPFHEQIREAGAVVWLERYGIYASARQSVSRRSAEGDQS